MNKPTKGAVATSVEQCFEQDAQDGIVVKKRRRKPKVRSSFDQLGDQENILRYVLVYGSDNIWDTRSNIAMKPVALRLAIGNEAFKEWVGNPDKLIVQPSQIVFDPTETCSRDCINLFTGLPMMPVEGDCGYLLHLLHQNPPNEF